ncbi:MAG: sugar ABC transporter permease [Chloroflexota bacterium]
MSDQAITKTTQTSRRKGRSDLQKSRSRLAWIFLSPTLLVVAFVALYPLVQTIYFSFTDRQQLASGPPNFVGFQNYTNVLTGIGFPAAVQVTILFTIMTVVFEFILGMIIALVINSNFKGRGPMRAAMLIPWAIPTVIAAQMWNWMYNDIYGVINDLLVNQFGILSDKIAFTAGGFWLSMAAVSAVDIWKTTPFVALLLLAGLQTISTDVYEAADVDGANPIQQFFAITLPLLRPAIVVALIFRTLDALRVFDVFFALFGQRLDTQTMAVLAQQELVTFGDIGEGAAICVLIFIIIAIFVGIYVTVFKVEEA